MFGRRSAVLPVMGVFTVIAVAVGLQLGESAIASIDPVHFKGAQLPVRDVSEDRQPGQVAAFTSAYGWAEAPGVVAAECAGCGARTPAPVGTGTVAAGIAAREQPDRPAVFDAPPRPAFSNDAAGDTALPQWREVSRYVHYPINEEQSNVAAARTEPAGVTEPADGGRSADPTGL